MGMKGDICRIFNPVLRRAATTGMGPLTKERFTVQRTSEPKVAIVAPLVGCLSDITNAPERPDF